MQVPVVVRALPDDGFAAGFVESDGHVAIEAAHYQRIVAPSGGSGSSSSNVTYHTLTGYGPHRLGRGTVAAGDGEADGRGGAGAGVRLVSVQRAGRGRP